MERCVQLCRSRRDTAAAAIAATSVLDTSVGFFRKRYYYHDKLVGAGKPRTPQRMGGQNPCTAEAAEEAEEGEAALHRRHLRHRQEVASRDGEKFRMKGEKAGLNFPKLFLKIADPHLSDGDSELTQQLLQEWRNNAFHFEAIEIFELLQYWSYALNFAVKGLLMTLNGLRPIMNSPGHGGEWVVKIRLRRSRHGNGGLDVIKLKGEKTRLNFPKLFLSTCEKGKGIIMNPGIKIEIPLEDILQCKEMRLRDAAKSHNGT